MLARVGVAEGSARIPHALVCVAPRTAVMMPFRGYMVASKRKWGCEPKNTVSKNTHGAQSCFLRRL